MGANVARQRHRAAFITGAVLGGLAGAAITLWRAPQSGRETRAQIGAMITAHAGPLAEPLAAFAERLNDVGESVLEKVAGITQPEAPMPPTEPAAPTAEGGVVTAAGQAPAPHVQVGAVPAAAPSTPTEIRGAGPVAAAPMRTVEPRPLTEEEREALDLDPVIEPEELPQAREADPGDPLAALQAGFLQMQSS
jgi:hypothetical protein